MFVSEEENVICPSLFLVTVTFVPPTNLTVSSVPDEASKNKFGLFGEISYLSPIDLRGKTTQSEINFSEIDSYVISTGIKITL